jgi:RNA polymerase sigma-70 factor (ECF subfamily)
LETAKNSGKLEQIKTRADFEVLFKSHYSPLCSYANQFLRDVDASEEAVQEVMFRIWTRRDTLVINTSMKSYLFRAVRNSCMNAIKHQKVKDEYRMFREHEGDSHHRSMEEDMIASELQERIREAIDQLPVARRKVFILSRYDGLTYPQIAEKLDISVKTVENQMGKALKTLREELREYLPVLMLVFWN